MYHDYLKHKCLKKTTTVTNKRTCVKVDIAAFQETSIGVKGSIREKDYTPFSYSKFVNEKREHYLEFAVKNPFKIC